MEPDGDQIDALLRLRGVRVTQARRSVFELLSGSALPLSAARIDEMLGNAGRSIDLVTIYRTLETLERCGLITRADRFNEGWRYMVISREHHHMIVCSECGSASPLDVCDLNRIEQSLERTTGFTNIRHSLQFYGICAGCRR